MGVVCAEPDLSFWKVTVTVNTFDKCYCKGNISEVPRLKPLNVSPLNLVFMEQTNFALDTTGL